MDALKEFEIENHRELVDDFIEFNIEEYTEFLKEQSIEHDAKEAFIKENAGRYMRFLELTYNAGDL